MSDRRTFLGAFSAIVAGAVAAVKTQAKIANDHPLTELAPSVTPQSLAFHENAFQFASKPITLDKWTEVPFNLSAEDLAKIEHKHLGTLPELRFVRAESPSNVLMWLGGERIEAQIPLKPNQYRIARAKEGEVIRLTRYMAHPVTGKRPHMVAGTLPTEAVRVRVAQIVDHTKEGAWWFNETTKRLELSVYPKTFENKPSLDALKTSIYPGQYLMVGDVITVKGHAYPYVITALSYNPVIDRRQFRATDYSEWPARVRTLEFALDSRAVLDEQLPSTFRLVSRQYRDLINVDRVNQQSAGFKVWTDFVAKSDPMEQVKSHLQSIAEKLGAIPPIVGAGQTLSRRDVADQPGTWSAPKERS